MRSIHVLLYTALAVVTVSSGSVGSSSRQPSSSVAFSPGYSGGLARPGSVQHPGHVSSAPRYPAAANVRHAMMSLSLSARTLSRERPLAGFPRETHRRFGLRPRGASAQDTASSGGAKATTQKSRDLSELDVDTLHDKLESLLDEQWQRAAAESGLAPAPSASTNATWGKVKHVVGGFSVVVRMPEEGLAYRMQPMRSVKAGLTWVAFYMMLQEAVGDRQAGAEAAAADVLFRPDRSVILGSSKFRTSSPRKMAWEHLEVAQQFQSERLRKATKRLVYFRHELLKTSNLAYRQGLCTSAENCPISWADGGMLQGPCISNGLMFPSHWFWIQVGDPADIVVADDSTEDGDAALSNEVDIAPGAARRMKGSELASALLLRTKKNSPAPQRAAARVSTSTFANMTRAAPKMMTPAAVSVAPVKVLASVFPHAQGDVGGLCKRLWMGGAADNVTILVLQSVLRGLRRLHSVGVPHGDLKAANVLYVDGMFCLTDMPALNWSATPVLTKDPVAHTLLQGKRLLCNDMWGLGLITLSLVVGYTEMEAVKASLRKLEPRAYNASPGASRKMDAVTQNWLVVSLMLLHFLGRSGTPMAMDSANAATKALSSSWLRRHVPAVSSKVYLESCQKVAQTLAFAVLAPGRSAAIIESLAYCLDITDLARNSHGIPWPAEPDDSESASLSR